MARQGWGPTRRLSFAERLELQRRVRDGERFDRRPLGTRPPMARWNLRTQRETRGTEPTRPTGETPTSGLPHRLTRSTTCSSSEALSWPRPDNPRRPKPADRGDARRWPTTTMRSGSSTPRSYSRHPHAGEHGRTFSPPVVPGACSRSDQGGPTPRRRIGQHMTRLCERRCGGVEEILVKAGDAQCTGLVGERVAGDETVSRGGGDRLPIVYDLLEIVVGLDEKADAECLDPLGGASEGTGADEWDGALHPSGGGLGRH